ncbi:hypothetical protein [Streptomyces sp. NPDC059909]|uniref:hypothetical protein n=1 Tax=Streptomyces sp. NPDC059909 TaxID=3346998 RepID=UPI003655F217
MSDEVRVPGHLEEAELTAGEELAADPAFRLAHLRTSAATAPDRPRCCESTNLADGPRRVRTDASPIAVCTDGFSPRTIPLAPGITDAQAQALADALAGRAQSAGAEDAR